MTIEIIERQLQLANARVDRLAKFERVFDIAHKRHCEAHLSMSYDEDGVEWFEGSTCGPRGLNNHWVDKDQERLLDRMIVWLETAKEK